MPARADVNRTKNIIDIAKEPVTEPMKKSIQIETLNIVIRFKAMNNMLNVSIKETD